MDEIAALIASARKRFAPDSRLAIFDVEYAFAGGDLVLSGASTEAVGIATLVDEARALSATGIVVDRVRRLPDAALGERRFAVVRAAFAPVLAAPRASATQTSQNLLGATVELLERHGPWVRVRGRDGYLGWTHHGYLVVHDAEGAAAWTHPSRGKMALSLDALIVDESGQPVVRLPWGARAVLLEDGRVALPDGRRGRVAAGEIVSGDDLPRHFPLSGAAVVETARRWAGTPYLWGGVTTSGADCSGFVQSVFRVHGLELPRDSDMQARCGEEVRAGDAFENLHAGDLLFFAESGNAVDHVAISAGGGRIVHAAITNGGVAEDDLTADYEVAARLRSIFHSARRVI